jgi:hypothetical protein
VAFLATLKAQFLLALIVYKAPMTSNTNSSRVIPIHLHQDISHPGIDIGVLLTLNEFNTAIRLQVPRNLDLGNAIRETSNINPFECRNGSKFYRMTTD